jgi:hypothetical protein
MDFPSPWFCPVVLLGGYRDRYHEYGFQLVQTEALHTILFLCMVVRRLTRQMLRAMQHLAFRLCKMIFHDFMNMNNRKRSKFKTAKSYVKSGKGRIRIS